MIRCSRLRGHLRNGKPVTLSFTTTKLGGSTVDGTNCGRYCEIKPYQVNMGKLNGHRPEWAKVSLVFDTLSVITIATAKHKKRLFGVRMLPTIFQSSNNFSGIDSCVWPHQIACGLAEADFFKPRISYDKCWMVTYPYAYEIAVYYRRIVLVLKYLLCSILDYIRAVTCTFCLFNVKNNLFKRSE